MEIRVFKFGGSSLADAKAISHVCRLISREEPGLAVVVSAMGGMTDLLLGAAQKAAAGDVNAGRLAADAFDKGHRDAIQGLVNDPKRLAALNVLLHEAAAEFRAICQSLVVLKELTPKASAKTVARGERMMARLIVAVLEEMGEQVAYIDAQDIIKVTNGVSGMAPEPKLCEQAANAKIIPLLKTGQLVVMPGFLGEGPDGDVVTLGRGGSDYSATLLGASLNAKSVSLYKEVDGLLTADPRYVKEARIVPELHYREAAELAYYGAKVLHPRTIIPLLSKQIPLIVKNTFHPEDPGTRIAGDVPSGAYPVKALTAIPSQALVAVEGNGMMGVPGIAGRTFQALARAQISVSVISQASSESSICFVVPGTEAVLAKDVLSQEFQFEIEHSLIDQVRIQSNVAVVAVVGLGMSGTPGIASRAFGSMARERINIMAIAQGSSELNISVVISSDQVPLALNALHREYRLEKIRALPHSDGGDISIALFGFGQIGRTLVEQLIEQNQYFKEKMQLGCKIIGLADTSGLRVNEIGFPTAHLAEILASKKRGEKLVASNGVRMSLTSIAKTLKDDLWSLPVGRGIFVDTTAEDTAPLIKEAMRAGFHVVVANKKPLAVDYAEYSNIWDIARTKNLMLRYEATVGAGLPILDTLVKLEAAGDKVEMILGCFSGTLGYLMTQMEDGVAFSEAVRKAFALGYTEPDPREDLSGMDVARKALILARTLGSHINMIDIDVEPLFPNSISHNDPHVFLENLKSLDGAFAERIASASKDKCVLRYVARLAGNDVSVRIEALPTESPLGRLRGTDNQVTLTTKRYKAANPLIVTGPGAGAEVTAAGVLNDIIAIATSQDRGQ